MWATLIVLASLGAAPEEIYIYPDVYEHGEGLGAAVNEEALAKLIDDNSTSGDGEDGIPWVEHKIDLNNDGKAEIFLAPSRTVSTRTDWYDIFTLKDGRYERIGGCAIFFSLRKSENGYARILNHNNVGNRPSPIWNASISVYDGTRYVAEHVSDLTSGQMEAKGLEAYGAKDYAVAEIWFLNLLRSGLCGEIQATNNLALVLMRTKRYQEAIDRIEKALAAGPGGTANSYKANAHYNLGKAYEALENLPAALKNYYEACKLLPTDDRKATLKRLVELGADTAGYEPIW